MQRTASISAKWISIPRIFYLYHNLVSCENIHYATKAVAEGHIKDISQSLLKYRSISNLRMVLDPFRKD